MNFWLKTALALTMLATVAVTSNVAAQTEARPQVTIHTTKGDIRLELYADQAPLTVENFLQYANDGFYEGTVFHRVISYFMIQGGGMTVELEPKANRESVQNEATNGLKNLRGTIAMARTNDPHSATSQFFINVQANPVLDNTGTAQPSEWGYTVFGHVIDGMTVVDDIRFVEVGTAPNGMPNVPVEPVIIESVTAH